MNELACQIASSHLLTTAMHDATSNADMVVQTAGGLTIGQILLAAVAIVGLCFAVADLVSDAADLVSWIAGKLKKGGSDEGHGD